MQPNHSTRPILAAALAVAAFSATVSTSSATVLLNEPFTYTDGPLLGQGGWTITGTSTVNPYAVASGKVPFTNNGQDAYKAFTAPTPNTAGTSLYTYFTLNLSAALATGDYFIHLSDPAGTTTNFYERVHAKSSGAGFVLGLAGTSGTPTYGTTELPFSTDIQVLVAWNFVTGAANDTFNLYVNPTASTEAGNTSYLGITFTGTEPTATLAAFNLRQGTAANAPSGSVDNVIVATDYNDIVAAPEPTAFSALLGGASLLGLIRRRRS